MRILLIIFTFLLSVTAPSFAESPLTQRQDVKAFIQDMVKTHHFNQKEMQNLFDTVKIQQPIIDAMNRPYEKKPWDIYKQLFLTPERVQAGLTYWAENKATLARAEKQYGVPANVIVAIIGVETLYGKHQGNYRVIDALSTLAFDYPKRSAFFTKELKEYLLLCREHHVSPALYLGSYAGAMGKPQFIPSSYRYYAVNFSGNPKKDLMHDDEAVIASVANYFHQHGWHLNEAVTQPANISGSRYKKIHTDYKTATYHPRELARAGVKPATRSSERLPEHAGLIELTTQLGSEFWVTYPNFYVITRYNTSPQYALVVYLLSQQLNKQWASLASNKYHG